jgi:hypothetical protein
MIRSHWLKGSAVFAACLSLLTCGASAHAGLVITPTFGSSITSDPNAAAIEGVINSAIAVYQSKFTDPITVTIQFNEMNSGLGQSVTGFYNVPYQSYLNALTADAKSANDATALAHLPAGPNNPVNGDASINVKSANARAVGLPGSFPGIVNGTFDGAIGLNTHITDVGSPGTSGQFSLLATVEHEIDEVLGLGSSLPSQPFSTIFPEDLYRYDSTGGRSFTTSSSAQAFFSIDGTTLLAQFDNQNDGGDFGDWQSNPLPNGVSPQVQDAFATPFAHPTLGDNEITALDVIGYDLAQAVVTPEPASMTLLATGTMLLAGYRLRRRTRPVA